MAERKPLICIVDDDDMVRESVAMLVATVDMDCRQYSSCRAFLDDREIADCDCLVLDVRLPGLSGIELQERLVAQHRDTPIIFISGHGDIPMAVKAVRLGALDFLQKPFSEQLLLDRINQGVNLAAERRQRRQERQVVEARLALLTPRERAVLDLMVLGRSNKLIGDELGISVRTVEQHRIRVMEKMRARTLAELFHALSPVRNDLPDT